MFGADLLIAPRIRETLDPYEVTLPAGLWYDYWTGVRMDGGSKINVDPPLDSLPIYVRGGAIIPHQPQVQTTAEVPKGPLQLSVYPGPACHGSVYADDGNTFNYQNGEYFRQAFSCEVSAGGVRVRLDAPQGKYNPWWSTISVTAFGAPHAARQVTVAGRAGTNWKYNAHDGTIRLELPATRGATEISITY